MTKFETTGAVNMDGESTIKGSNNNGATQNVGPIEGQLPKEMAEEVIQEALVWASLHGLVMGDKSFEV